MSVWTVRTWQFRSWTRGKAVKAAVCRVVKMPAQHRHFRRDARHTTSRHKMSGWHSIRPTVNNNNTSRVDPSNKFAQSTQMTLPTTR